MAWNLNPPWVELGSINPDTYTSKEGLLASAFNKVVENLQYLYNHLGDANMSVKEVHSQFLAPGSSTTISTPEGNKTVSYPGDVLIYLNPIYDQNTNIHEYEMTWYFILPIPILTSADNTVEATLIPYGQEPTADVQVIPTYVTNGASFAFKFRIDAPQGEVGPIGPPGPSVAAGLTILNINESTTEASSKLDDYGQPLPAGTAPRLYWQDSTDPRGRYKVVITEAQHRLGVTSNLLVFPLTVTGTSGTKVSYEGTIADYDCNSDGTYTIYSNIKWSGKFLLGGGIAEVQDSEARRRLDSVEERCTQNEADIDSLEGRATSLETRTSNLETRVTNHDTEISGLKTRMSTAESDIDSLEGRMTTAENDIDSNTEAIESLAKKVDETAHFLGMFSTPEELRQEHPTATPNDFANVVSTGTVWIYQNGAWADSEEPYQSDTTLLSDALPAIPSTSRRAGTGSKAAREDHSHGPDVNKVDKTTKINGHALSTNIDLTAADVEAIASVTFSGTAMTVSGTSASITQAAARAALGLGSMAYENTSDWVPASRTVNGKALSSNITLTAADVGAIASVKLGSYSFTVNGTEASITQENARSALGLGSMAYENTPNWVPATRTVNGKALSTNISINKSDIGLGNVANERQYSSSNPPPYPVTSVNGKTGDVIVESGGGSDWINVFEGVAEFINIKAADIGADMWSTIDVRIVRALGAEQDTSIPYGRNSLAIQVTEISLPGGFPQSNYLYINNMISQSLYLTYAPQAKAYNAPSQPSTGKQAEIQRRPNSDIYMDSTGFDILRVDVRVKSII